MIEKIYAIYKKVTNFLHIYKSIKLAYIINFIVILSTIFTKKFGLELSILLLSNYSKNLISKNIALITLLKEYRK